MIWKVSKFCGVEVVTYAIMPNHFHVLIRVPRRELVSDDELLRKYKILHPKTDRFQTARIEVIADWLKKNTLDGREWREKQLALMFDVSAFMKLLKQRFTRWFNLTHRCFGALWAERYKSVLVQFEDDHTLRTMAAYIDLNAVRKGLVQDPKDYLWCGYAEAVAGSKSARKGLYVVCPHLTWTKAQAHYRTLLYCTGAAPREKGHLIDGKSFQAVMAKDGHLTPAELLRMRWRYFTAASVLGSHAFVEAQRTRLAQKKIRSLTSPKKPPSTSANIQSSNNNNPPPLPSLLKSPTPPTAVTPWGGWNTLHRVNKTGGASET